MSHWIFTLENLFKLIIRPLEWVMLVAVIGGGVFLLVHSKGIPLLKLKPAFRLLFLKEKDKEFHVSRPSPRYLPPRLA